MSCSGLAADVYDLYVLGLLDGEDRTRLEDHIREQCPACVRNVQRSMNLWLVFASTLENAEPPPDMRARLVRIAKLSKRVLTIPKIDLPERRPGSKWGLLAIGAPVLGLLLWGTWSVGRQSAGLQQARLAAEVTELTRRMSLMQVQLARETEERLDLERAVGSNANSAADQQILSRKLLAAENEAEQYKATMERDRQIVADNARLISILSSPGVRLLSLKATEATAQASAYVLELDNSKLIFVGSNLPKLPDGKDFQLWEIRTQDPKIVSAGVFHPGDDATVVAEFDLGTLVSDISSVEITEESAGGAPAPSGTALFSTPPPSH